MAIQKNLKAAIVGSRTFNDYNKLEHYIYNVCIENNYQINAIISGGAAGADTLAEKFALNYGLHLTVIKPEWDKYGKSAGFIRNHDIIKNCDICFIFWDGISKGTKHDIDLCQQYNKKYFLCEF